MKQKEKLYNSVAPIAEEFRKNVLKHNGPIKDTFDTLEQLGFFIVRFPAPEELSGFYIKKNKYNCIFVNTNHTLGRQYYSAWHECYHAYTGEVGSISLLKDIEYDEMEQKAEYFASLILMPGQLISKYLRENGINNLQYISYNQLITMQTYFQVSFSALLTRLIQLYPEKKKYLSMRYNLSREEKHDELYNKTLEVVGDTSLIKPTREFIIPERLYQLLHTNLEMDRITTKKAQSVLELIEKMEEKVNHEEN